MAKFYKWNFINRAIIKNYIKKDLAKTSYSFEVDVEKEEISAYAELEINGKEAGVVCIANVASSLFLVSFGKVTDVDAALDAIDEFNEQGVPFIAKLGSDDKLMIGHDFLSLNDSVFKHYFGDCLVHLQYIHQEKYLDKLLGLVEKN